MTGLFQKTTRTCLSLGRLLLTAVDDFGRRCWCENGVDRFLQLERLKCTMGLTVFLQLERSKSTPGLGATHAVCFFVFLF